MNRQPELYRTPRKPGYLGGYNWRATVLRMPAARGREFRRHAVHRRPVSISAGARRAAPAERSRAASTSRSPGSSWGWRYCTSQDERIRKPFFEGEMIVFAGSFLCVGIFFVLASRRSRKLTENAEDLHGSARWADENGYRATPGCSTHKHGVYVGGWCPRRRTPAAAISGTTAPNTFSRSRRRGAAKASAW